MVTPFLQYTIDQAMEQLELITDHATSQWSILKTLFWDYSHHSVPIAILIVMFWPIFVTLVVALTSASGWLFWLFTSVIFGVIQLLYVTYQFIVISFDIAGLSVLKTFAMMRSKIRRYVRHKKISRQREWRTQVDKAGTYKNFLKIPIAPKRDETNYSKPSTPTKVREEKKSSTTPSSPKSPSCRKNIERSTSYSSAELSPFRSISLARNKSFDNSMTAENEPDNSVLEEELGMTGSMLCTTSIGLREARMRASSEETEEAASSLKRLLSAVIKRNHLTVEDILLDNARSTAESGQYGLSTESRNAIHTFYEEVEKGLDWIAESPLLLERTKPPGDTSPCFDPFVLPLQGSNDMENDPGVQRENELSERITLVRKMKQNMGRTALMLSGGGAQAMYHLGSIRALVESKAYNNITVISGTSGGSITAAMCALMRADELHRDVSISTVSTDYRLDGRMKKENIRWFPPVVEMGAYWLKHKLLVDSADFRKCCEFYYGDVTFEEAFKRTEKHVCITVSASRASAGTAQRLLLNHISTPHVTLASAVAASCALPGVMAPTKLFTKNTNGEQEPFEVDGVEWIDGSVQADLPFQRISTLFNVSNYVVCQTNFHVVPFLNKAHHPNRNSLYWRVFQTWEWDIRNRALKLSRLGLFPRIFGQDFTKAFKQRYHGNLTLVPRFTTMQTFGLKALANPTEKDMEGYLKYGQIAAWPYLNLIQDMTRLESALDACLSRLQERFKTLIPESDWSGHDEVDSIASSSFTNTHISNRVRFIGSGRESERLKHKVMTLERENLFLRQRVEDMEREMLGEQVQLHLPVLQPKNFTEKHTKRSSEEETMLPGSSRVTEREVWSQIKRLGPSR